MTEVAMILIILWLPGMISGITFGGWIWLLFVGAISILLIQILRSACEAHEQSKLE
ncbi:MAG: DUF5670 family protein [Candidatus Altimarinota bacterium]